MPETEPLDYNTLMAINPTGDNQSYGPESPFDIAQALNAVGGATGSGTTEANTLAGGYEGGSAATYDIDPNTGLPATTPIDPATGLPFVTQEPGNNAAAPASTDTTGDNTLQTVADLLSQMMGQNVNVPTATPSSDVTVAPTASTSSTSPVIIVLIVAAIGFGAWYWYKHKHTSEGE